MSKEVELVRISQGAIYRYCAGDAWIVGVKVVGTAGSLSRYGLAMTDREKFWDFTETTEEIARSVGQ